MSIDTLKIYEGLVASGIPEKQAKMQVIHLVEIETRIEDKLDVFVTKEYLSKEFSILRAEIKSEMSFNLFVIIGLGILLQIILKHFGLL